MLMNYGHWTLLYDNIVMYFINYGYWTLLYYNIIVYNKWLLKLCLQYIIDDNYYK